MGYQVITLKNETDGMIAVGIPITVSVFLCGNAVDYQITAVIPVQTTDHIQQCGLAGTTGAQNCHKFIVTQIQAHTCQRRLHQFTGNICFSNILNLKHKISSLQIHRIRCICNNFIMQTVAFQACLRKNFNYFTLYLVLR